ncbi:MAG: TonB-dependent receptor [Bacteroidota bacterium]|nr:TonB-dependent receptor [Bacteroidota bacterium]
MQKHIIYIFLLICSIQIVSAQADTLEKGNITLVRPYRPKIQESIKKAITPLPETAMVSMPPFTYTFNSIEPNYQINTPGYKAVNLPQEKLSSLNGNFTKLGFGNYNSPFLEVSLNNLRSRNWMLAANARHYSLNGKNQSRKYSNNQLHFVANYTGDKSISGAVLLYNRDAYRYYAHESNKTDTLPKGALYNPYQNIQLNTFTSSKAFDSTQLYYRLDLKLDNMIRSKEVNEQCMFVNVNLKKIVRGNLLKTDFLIDIDQYINQNKKYNRNFIKLQPEYHFTAENFKAIFGLNAIMLNQNRDTANANLFQFYPKLTLEYTIAKKYKVYTGMWGDWEKYTLKNIYEVNPFISPNIKLDNNKNFNLHIGAKGHINNNLDLSIEARYTNMDNLVMYTVDSTYLHAMDLIIVSAGVRRLILNAHYHVGNKIDIYSSLIISNYKLSDTIITRASQLPTFVWKNNFSYKLGDKVYMNLQLNYTGARYLVKYDKTSKEYNNILMKPYADISLNADYRYSKYVSMFLNINNVISNKYVKWYGYPVVGINAQIGITITL